MSIDILLDIENIDFKATAKNVKNFLDHKLPHVLRIANESPSALQSPVINDMPVTHDGGNHNEDKLIKYIAAKELINSVAQALNNCSQTAFIILKGKYIKGLSDWQIEQNMCYSHAKYYQLRDEAYNEFADCFELQKGGIDLHIYQNE